jgi:hypothetical protein
VVDDLAVGDPVLAQLVSIVDVAAYDGVQR